MFKFIRQYAEQIQGAQLYPLISLVIFFLFFVLLLWYVTKMDKQRINTISSIPLESEEPIANL